MARMATRIASGLAAAGIAIFMSTAPAQARPCPGGGVDCVGVGCTYTPPVSPTTQDVARIASALTT